MARFSSRQPEEREWVKALQADPIAAEEPLLRLVRRMEEEGDWDDQYASLVKLLLHYCRNGERAKALAIVDRVDTLLNQVGESDLGADDATGWWDLSTAQALIFHLQEYDRAVPYIDRDLARIRPEHDLSHRCHYGAWLLGLKLVTQLDQNIKPGAVASTLRGMSELLANGFPHSQFIPSFRKLIEAGESSEDLKLILTKMWSDLATQYRFYGYGDPQALSEIEELLSMMGMPVINEI